MFSTRGQGLFTLFDLTQTAYNGLVAEIPKVPEDQFKAVIRALLNTPPMPMSDIPRKREKAEPKSKKRSYRRSRSPSPS